MAKQTIRINIFYSDFNVFLELRAGKRQEKMIDLANQFFGKYNFELDTRPFPYDYVAYRDAFVLKEYNGIKPDVGMVKLAEDMKADEALAKKLSAEMALVTTTAERRLDIKWALDDLRERSDEFVWRGNQQDAEHPFRMAIGTKIDQDKTFRKFAAQISKAPRLAVAFCEFETPPPASKKQQDVAGMQILGLDNSKRKSYRTFKKPVPKFTDPFVIIDVRRVDWRTVSHEIVHAYGRPHPDPNGKYGDDAGYYDGPHESVMNYFSADMKPSETILEEKDQKGLAQAFFVR